MTNQNEKITLLRDLAVALHVSPLEVGVQPEQLIYGESMYNSRRELLGEMAIEAIRKQQLAGRLALRAYDTFGRSSLKHGSYLSPPDLTTSFGGRLRTFPVLKPKQAYWRDADGRLYKDGEPAICTAATYDYPLLLSILNRNRIPDFEGFVLSSRSDSTGAKYDFTRQAFLAAIESDNNTGWVYMINRDMRNPEHSHKYRDPSTHDAWEYRLSHDVHPVTWIETSPSDLPPELLVVDGDHHIAHDFVRTLPQTTLMEQIDRFEGSLDVRPLGGLFPLGLHPHNRENT